MPHKNTLAALTPPRAQTSTARFPRGYPACTQSVSLAKPESSLGQIVNAHSRGAMPNISCDPVSAVG